MHGTEKQVAWAQEIKSVVMPVVAQHQTAAIEIQSRRVDRLQRDLKAAEQGDDEREVRYCREDLAQGTMTLHTLERMPELLEGQNAEWWIDNRGHVPGPRDPTPQSELVSFAERLNPTSALRSRLYGGCRR